MTLLFLRFHTLPPVHMRSWQDTILTSARRASLIQGMCDISNQGTSLINPRKQRKMKCRKSSILLIALIVISGSIWSQSAAVKRAERNLKHFDFAKAAENYKIASDKKPADLSLKEKLARAYVLLD